MLCSILRQARRCDISAFGAVDRTKAIEIVLESLDRDRPAGRL